MDEKEIKSLIESTFTNMGKKNAIHNMDDNGKQYVMALAKHCKSSDMPFPYTSAWRICKEKFNYGGSQDAFRRAAMKIEADELTL